MAFEDAEKPITSPDESSESNGLGAMFEAAAHRYENPGANPAEANETQNEEHNRPIQKEALLEMKECAKTAEEFICLWLYANGHPFRAPYMRESQDISREDYARENIARDFDIAQFCLDQLKSIQKGKGDWQRIYNDLIQNRFVPATPKEIKPVTDLLKEKIEEDQSLP